MCLNRSEHQQIMGGVIMKSHLIGFGLVAMSVMSLSTHGAPVRWTVAAGGNGNYYEIIVTNPPTFRTWGQANGAASSQVFNGISGYLATITSQEEHDFIQALDWSTTLPTLNGAWIGGVQPSGSGEPDTDWQWVTGEVWDYTNWGGGEPNNQNEEDWLMVNAPTSKGGLWNDENGATAAYIVEFESTVPLPEAIWLFSSGLLGLLGMAKRRKT